MRVRNRNGYFQRAIPPKVGKPELQFMCSARPLIVLYICVKFCENISSIGCHAPYTTNISDGFRFMERTQVMEALTDGRTDTRNFGRYNITPSPLFVAGHRIVLPQTDSSFLTLPGNRKA